MLLTILIFLAAVLYASVGHAGSSGYQAAMALCGVSASVMKPSALILNIFVAAIATARFTYSGSFDRKLWLPLALGAAPFAYFGGKLAVPIPIFKPLLGLVLIIAAARLAFFSKNSSNKTLKPMPFWVGLLLGALIGFISGITGTGGGIFLTPILLFANWSEPKTASGVSAAFILTTSICALIGTAPKLAALPSDLPLWALAAIIGGTIGATLGAKRLATSSLRYLLAIVLVVAAWKLIVVK
jgi:uncharacterized protein